MSAPIITFEDIEAVLAKLDRTRVNPIVPGNCAYTSETDPTHHCIVGQIWHELGRYVPGPGAPAASVLTVLRGRGELDDYAPGVVTALQAMQVEADEAALSIRADGTWGAIIDAWPRFKREAKRWVAFSAPVPS